MEANLEQLVTKLKTSPFSTDVLQQITLLLQSQTNETLPKFVSDEYHSLLILEHNTWHLLGENSHTWLNEPCYIKFFQALVSFNKGIIFGPDTIEVDIKSSLLLPNTTDQTDSIFEKIKQSKHHNDPFISFASLWFDNLSFFVHEFPQAGHSPTLVRMNHYITGHFILSKTFKCYITQLFDLQLSPSIFTSKQLFYMKTCPLALGVYFYMNPQTFDYSLDEILEHIGNEYLKLIRNQSHSIEFWSKELLGCISCLISFVRSMLWWEGENGAKLKLLFSTEKVLCEYIQDMIRIVDYKDYYTHVMTHWINDETIILDSALLSLMNIVQSQNINWFFRSMTQLPGILLQVAETCAYYRICLCVYGLLSEILTDDHLKALTFPDDIRIFVLKMIEQAWHSPTKRYKQIPIIYFLRGFANISKNDYIQKKMAESGKISLFVEMCDEYPIVYEIIWALSFNQDIQKQLRSNSPFMIKIKQASSQCDADQMTKTIQGIVWNLESNHQDHAKSIATTENTFDIMISYSHKEKVLCKQIYAELIKAGYRVWIDFDQMHGNVMDAMAQAIEQSNTVVICMSEQYRKSNYCRAEAQYAFQRERKIVPILLQKQYKPDGWLLFIIGQLLYVDFNKYEFSRAMEMLHKELKVAFVVETNAAPVRSQEDTVVAHSTAYISPPEISIPSIVSENILEWTQAQVQDWLLGHNLRQMSRLFTDCDGRSLVYLSSYIKNCESQLVLKVLEADSLRRINESISLIELSCFHSLMHEHKKRLQSTHDITDKKLSRDSSPSKIHREHSST
ncbi:unnamed protein product [Rotaria magnacalcarata]|uniref:TIR domain-containing protein n=3 Tax=Rotaria magnacalcarata TaxID=392030 RepID=A0A814WD17_9BILA|nr:unnamed protein product [Rotaria magnacalcarata]CAF2134644.1 unnamed protein product [Rotaria magnacalcarata]CAF3984608.1 unnamed protein product [Rotaria magnacalcarata]